MPKISTDRSTKQAGERPCEADGGPCLASDTKRIPSHVGANSWQKDGHIRRQAAATNVNVMPQFVDENERGKSRAELEAVQGPIEGEEGKKTKKEFQFEKCEKQTFALCQQDGNRSERTQTSCPLTFQRRRGSMFFRQLEFVDFAANPLCLIRILGKKSEGFSPFVAGLLQSVLFLEMVRFRGDAQQRFAVEQRVTLRAIESAKRHRLTAIVAVADGFNDGGRGQWWSPAGSARRRRRPALKRTDDIDLRRSSLLPGEAHANEQNY